jgi:hypothetical protein
MEEIIEYPNNIEISGSRTDDDQFWRVQRIHRVLGYAQAFADIDNNEDYYKKIASIHDYKGILTITWKVEPINDEKEYLDKAWESIVTNYESESIEHKLNK